MKTKSHNVPTPMTCGKRFCYVRRHADWIIAVLALIGMAIVLIVAFSGCYAVPKHDDPMTDFDESSEETVVAGVPVYDQEVGTGPPLGPTDEGGWDANDWLDFGVTALLTLVGGNAGLAVASQRGRSNLANIFKRRSPAASKIASVAAVVLPSDSPPEAKAITAEAVKKRAEKTAVVAKATAEAARA
jgi:hypothetical protein